MESRLLLTTITTCLNRKLHGKGLPLKWVDDIKREILYVFDEVISVLSLEVVVCFRLCLLCGSKYFLTTISKH